MRSADTASLRGQARGFAASIRTVHRFRRYLYRHWRPLLAAFVCSLGYAAARLAEPWPLKVIFDNVLMEMPLQTPFPALNDALGGERMQILAAATLAILLLALARGVFYYYQRVLTATVGQAVVLKIRQRLFAHMQSLSLGFHAENRTGDLLTRLTGDINMLRELLVATLVVVVSESTILLGYAAIMLLVDWRVALVGLAAIPFIFVLTSLYAVRIRAAAQKQRRREGEVAARLQEVLSGIHVVQMFGREDEEEERLRGLNKRSYRSGLRAIRLEARLNRAVEISVAGATAAVLWYGSTQVIAGKLTPGELIVFLLYLQGAYRPLRRISRVAQRAARASVCVDRVGRVLEQEPLVRGGSRQAPQFGGRVSFEDVEFSYNPDVPVLRGVSFAVEPGETVALVGPTGAGKSTLLGLIPRLYDPTGGVVRIDGEDVRELTLKSLRDQISIVPQDGMLFGGDFRENIAYGKPDASDDEIEAAARAAHIHGFITSLPDGYATPIGERGVTLSGGQRQRLAIARALVRDAPIVLLDEPVTGLDAKSEALVLAALERLLAGRTAIVVAHKESTIDRADRIVVLSGGRIVEQGRPEQVALRDGHYRGLLHDLVESQPSLARTDSAS